MRRYQCGDISAFDQLEKQYRHSLVSAFRRWLIPIDYAEPEALANEVFLRGAESKQKYDADRGKVRTWMFAIAHNVKNEYLRSRYLQDAIANALTGAFSERQAVTQCEHSQIDTIRVQDAFGTLSHDHREILWLADVEEFTSTEIAGILHLKPEAVKSRVRRARTELRTALAVEPHSMRITGAVRK